MQKVVNWGIGLLCGLALMSGLVAGCVQGVPALVQPVQRWMARPRTTPPSVRRRQMAYTYTGTGAGDATVNTTFEFAGTYNGYPYWQSAGGRYLFWRANGARWVVDFVAPNENLVSGLYYSTDNTLGRPLTGVAFDVLNGTPPGVTFASAFVEDSSRVLFYSFP